MTGTGDHYERVTAEEDRGTIICHDCETHYKPGEYPNGCPACHERHHPHCACGCGQPATLVADVALSAGIDSRSPWASVEHARGAYNEGDEPRIDVVVPPDDLETIIAAAPCWCGMRLHTTCDWCPAHGAKE